MKKLLNTFSLKLRPKLTFLFAFLFAFTGLQGTAIANDLLIGQKVFKESIKQLNLSGAQKKEVAIILKKHRGETKALLNKLKSSRKNLMSTIQAENSSEQEVRSAFRVMANYGEELSVKRAQIRKEVAGVLSPEQKVKAKKLRQEFANKISNRMALASESMDTWIDQNSQ